ncbi:hypothetical protein [Candidatus Reidiella endopervernicosa]|uniref:Uncharacterized protein n=1 Tax=Candidatus Reidiella endopervernicosa TaxID=2738883 RepID=A0A6N0HY14_9GAMM|nr:hypothetical protein [Candidatus Reidiella endopervernicosa]QKQ27177.1 hypothetical protein HUE57_13410 [Candidatus Reidiella endopervernicosa]
MAVSEGAWSHSHKDVTHYFSSNVDGHFELFDAENFSRLYRVTARMTPDHSPDTHIIKGDGGSSTIIAIPELDNEDSPYLSLHLGTKDGGFSIWQPFAGEREVTDLFELANGLFAVRLDKSDWQLIRVKPNGSSQRVTLPSLPSEVPKIRKLTDGLFGVAIYDDALRRDKDDGALWHLFRINSGDEIEPLQLSGFEPGAVKSIHRISDHLLRLTSRTSEDVDHSLQTHFYRINESKQAIEVHKDITGIPDLTRNFRLLANGELVGAAEVDDADGDGTPGDWVWRMRDSQGEWRTPQEILPELSGKIWTMSDWHDGQGIGVQTMTGESGAEYTSQWYLRDNKTKQWHSAEKTLPLHDDLAIDTIHERRDGLFEITSMLDAAIKPDFDSPVPVVIQSTHWVMRAEDGEWNDVRSIVAKHRPGLEKKIIAVDARSNGLMVDIQRNHDETPIRLLFTRTVIISGSC